MIEKSEQVGLMSRIHQGAEWVFVWLGEDVDDSDFVMDVVNSDNSYSIEEVRDITQACLLPDVNVNLSEAMPCFGDYIRLVLQDEESRTLLLRSLAKLLQRS
jgi:hypothetical protein